jgi:uncharacterized membrane protein YfcA
MLGYIFEFWWMLPTAFCICLIATSSSIEGAVFFTPIFILLFPVIAGVRILPVEAIFIALSTELFGFGSALTGYLRRKLVDINISKKVLAVSIPLAVAFGFLAHVVPGGFIMTLLGVMMICLSLAMFYSFLHGRKQTTVERKKEGPPSKVDALGRKYWYSYRHGPVGVIWSGLGGVLVGLTGIGIGELTSTTLIVRNKLPVRIAIGTGIMIVALTVFPATLVHAFVFSTGDLNVHWNILFMTIPAVALGGQISPFINNRIAGEKMKVFLSIILIAVGVLLIWRAVGY